MDSRRLSPPSKPVRLHKFLADCGFGSRRACEALINEGRVTVDGVTVTGQGRKIVPGNEDVCVDGRRVYPEGKVYIAFHKPRDVICTASDPEGRRTIFKYLDSVPRRVYTVGRMDRQSEGLMLVTNDGALAHRLMHPRFHVEKTYRVWVDRPLTAEEMGALQVGIFSEGELLRAQRVRPFRAKGGPCYELVLREGRKRQIRRMLQEQGRKVRRLQRNRIGPLKLGSLPVGRWRYLAPDEVEALQRVAGGADSRPGGQGRPERSRPPDR